MRPSFPPLRRPISLEDGSDADARSDADASSLSSERLSGSAHPDLFESRSTSSEASSRFLEGGSSRWPGVGPQAADLSSSSSTASPRGERIALTLRSVTAEPLAALLGSWEPWAQAPGDPGASNPLGHPPPSASPTTTESWLSDSGEGGAPPPPAGPPPDLSEAIRAWVIAGQAENGIASPSSSSSATTESHSLENWPGDDLESTTESSEDGTFPAPRPQPAPEPHSPDTWISEYLSTRAPRGR